MMRSKAMARLGIFATVLTVVVVATTAQAKRPGGGGGGGQECLDVWDPVICSDGNVYSNLCYATRAGATGCVPFGDTLQATESRTRCPRPIECPMVWDPVVCCDGDVCTIYSNSCVAFQQCAKGCTKIGDGGPVAVP